MIKKRHDGTYEIVKNGMPYHVLQSDEIFIEVDNYAQNHPEEVEVIPEPLGPTPEERKNQSLTALDAEYQPQFQELQFAWAAANLDGNTDLEAAIQTDYAALKAEYQTKREEIDNG